MENENTLKLAVSTMQHLKEEIKNKSGNTAGKQQLVDEIMRQLQELSNNPLEELVPLSARDYHETVRPYLPEDL